MLMQLSQDYPCIQSRDWIELDEMTILVNSSALYFVYAPLGNFVSIPLYSIHFIEYNHIR